MKNSNINIIITSNEIFKGTKPLEGKALRALQNAIKESGKDKPTLKNRK